MSGRYEAGEKFLRVIQLFQRLSDTEVGLTTAQLAEELEVTTRSVQRYIATLRDSAGIDIVELDGRFRIGDFSKLPPMQLDHYQATALLVAVRLLYKMRPAEQDPALIGALAQLARALRVPVVNRYLEAIIAAAEAQPQHDDRWAVDRAISDGFVRRQVVAIAYRDAQGKESRRSIRPYFLEPRPEGRTIYLFALDERTDEVRSFRMDRITEARVIGPEFTVPDDFDIDAMLQSAWGIWHGEPNDAVVLRFSPSVARRVHETPWHSSAELADLPDGGVEMKLAVASEVEMRPWVLGWGAAVEVLGPPSLRDHVAATMREGAARYERG